MSRQRDTFEMFQEPERGRFGENERDEGIREKTPKLHDLTLIWRDERPAAIAVVDPAKPGGKWAWLPKSQIEFERGASGTVVVTLPEWLAREKELI